MNKEQKVKPWLGPAPMEPGDPDPYIIHKSGTVYVAYIAQDPDFPGWEDSSILNYLGEHKGEPYAVLKFEVVSQFSLGPPGEYDLHKHPLYGHGLEQYSFHQTASPDSRFSRWIVTFHDETLDITAQKATAIPFCYKESAEEAIKSIIEKG